MNKSTAMKRLINDPRGGHAMPKIEVAIRNAGIFKAFKSKSGIQANFNEQLIDLKEEFSLTRAQKEGLDIARGPVDDIPIFENKEVVSFFSQYLDLDSSLNITIEKNQRLSHHSKLVNKRNIILLEKLNNFRLINKSLEEINGNLPKEGYLLGSFETFTVRAKKRLFCNVPVLNHICASLDFIFNRVCPKLPYIKKVYFYITKGKNRLLSKAEALGRLVSCGFEIVDITDIDDVNYFIVKKVKEPSYDMNPSYGPLFKMRRVGKNGKLIGVYKFRTMHPYSEYLQDYVLKLNGYSETGKPADDFRLVPWGKFLRKYWLDELPQLINVFKGELKFVGIRPVSERYLQDIPADIRTLRLSQKPGCIPPYVSLNRRASVESVLQAEKEYLLEKVKNPYFTDTKYFFKAMSNILFRGKRSA